MALFGEEAEVRRQLGTYRYNRGKKHRSLKPRGQHQSGEEIQHGRDAFVVEMNCD